MHVEQSCNEWLRDYGYDPDEIVAFEDVDFDSEKRGLQGDRAVTAGLKLWLQSEGFDVDKIADEDLRDVALEHTIESNRPAPILGTQVLRDGKTGDPYDRPVTVGVMTMLKLHHLG